VEDVRLVRNKTTGESRGFAFVDFATVADAVTLMSYCPYDVEGPRLEIDGYSVSLSYGREMRNPPPPINFNSSTPAQRAAAQKGSDAPYFNDWMCSQVELFFSSSLFLPIKHCLLVCFLTNSLVQRS